MKTIVMTLVVGALLGAVAAAAFVYSGIYDVSASTPHSALASRAMSHMMHASVARRADDIKAPDLGDAAFAQTGINDFEAMCVGCHGAPGKSPEAIGMGLNPKAPDLAESAAHLTTAELFWVTKHGIKMTGMPAWGASHDDDTLWPVVALLTKLPGLDANAYAAMLAAAKGKGHHAEHDAGAHAGAEDPAGHGTHEHGVPARPADAPPAKHDDHVHAH